MMTKELLNQLTYNELITLKIKYVKELGKYRTQLKRINGILQNKTNEEK